MDENDPEHFKNMIEKIKKHFTFYDKFKDYINQLNQTNQQEKNTENENNESNTL